MNKRLQALLKRKAAAVETMKTIRAEAGEELFSAEQTTRFDAAKAEAEQISAAIEREQAAIEAERTLVLPDSVRIENGAPRAESDPRRGFAVFGDYLAAVRGAAVRPSAVDERLLIGAAALSTYGNETSGPDGGYLVPPQYATEILNVINGTDSVFSRVRQIPVGGNRLVIPATEQTAHGTTGVQAYWTGEAAAMTQSKPVFQTREIALEELTAIVPATERLLEDSTSAGAMIQMLAGEVMAFRIDDAIVNGTGVGQPMGIISAPGAVSVAKETSQVAATIVAENVLKMWSRLMPASRSRAVWLAHTDCDVQLMQMNIKVKNVAGTENVGGVGTPWMPPNGLSGSPYATLLGRPIIPVESCAALGTVGDLILADLSQYIAITKGGIKADQSMHFWFDQNTRAFRFVMRVGGQPWLSTAVARKNGSSTLGHFVTLATRA